MVARAAFYTSPSVWGTVKNPFGKDVANASLFRALAAHGGFDEIGILAHEPLTPEGIKTALLGDAPSDTRFWGDSPLRGGWGAKAGAVIRGKADLADMAWVRRATGDRDYSLVGIVHTIAPPAIREYIGKAATAPVQPWDALVCTSPAVQEALGRMFDEWGEYLASRFGGSGRIPRPELPLIPLGVDGERFRALADRPDARARRRAELGIAEADILVLWVGRLSFFEKAFPHPMMAAVEEAARATGLRIHLVMAGWFPNGEAGQALYEEAARAYAPTSPVRFVDGNDAVAVGELWAAADIFLSLVDNIQETFGLTPLEAMAAGLPVVASDWDGYRYTMRDGLEAFLVPTLGGPPGAGRMMRTRHVLGLDAYQTYVGNLAQYTAVHVGRAAEAIAALARDPELRRRMGRAGRERIRTAFDWPVVARQIAATLGDLAEKRAAAAPFEPTAQHVQDPVKGEPFRDFAGFASAVLNSATVLAVRPGALERLAVKTQLDEFANGWRADRQTCIALVDRLGKLGRTKAGDLLGAVPADRRQGVALAVVWMCKIGVLQWDAGGR